MGPERKHDHKQGDSPSGYDREVGGRQSHKSQVSQELDKTQTVRWGPLGRVDDVEVLDGEVVPVPWADPTGWEQWYDPSRAVTWTRFALSDEALNRAGASTFAEIQATLERLKTLVSHVKR